MKAAIRNIFNTHPDQAEPEHFPGTEATIKSLIRKMETTHHDLCGENIRKCYQCGKCTAGCPMADFMDMPPHHVIRFLQLRNEISIHELFVSNTIWCCVSCETCTTRCPQEVRLSRIMDACRETALETNCIPKDAENIVSFHKSFLDSIRLFGRIPEFYLTMNFKFRSLTPFQDIQLAPQMRQKGKLHLLPRKIIGTGEIKKIFKSCINRYQTGQEGK